MKRYVVLMVMLGLVGWWGTGSLAQTTFRFGALDNYPPLMFTENGVLQGIAIDVVQEMAKRLDIRVEFKIVPWARLMEEVKDGASDGGFGAFMTDERKTFCLYSGVLFYQ